MLNDSSKRQGIFLFYLSVCFYEAVKRGERLHVGLRQATAAPKGGRSLLSWQCFPLSCWLLLVHIHSFLCGSSALYNEKGMRERST